MIRVLVVDDSAFMRKVISGMLESDPGITVAGKARNGREGVELARQLKPDVITMDVEMPEMNGLQALQAIMRECPTNVIMISSVTTEGSHAALSAMQHGAVDIFAKDSSQISANILSIQDDLVARVKSLSHIRRERAKQPGRAATCEIHYAPRFHIGQFDLVCIGSSTGGPPVLEQIIGGLPKELSVPIVIAQHMPPMFTRSMAERLDHLCPLDVVHGADGMEIRRGTVYLAPGAKHLHIDRGPTSRLRMQVKDEPRDAPYRPSVDVLLSTQAEAVGKRGLGIVLTGMGTDGASGATDLAARGGTVLTQNAETCVIYGMPRAVDEAGASAARLSPSRIVAAISSLASARAAA